MKKIAKPKLGISFSGGLTSAVMTKELLRRYRHTHDVVVAFSNTGWEHPATLDFVRDCDTHFGFGTVWLEAVVSNGRGHGHGIRHKVVTYETASREAEPFRDYIAKYGIPNMGNPSCSGRLKEDVIHHYLRSIGWGPRAFETAIGIRADEADRQSPRMHEDRFIYPLVEWGIRKEDVIAEVEKWPFKLELPGEHYGNCVGCWKKSLRKLVTVAKHTPEWFDFPARMEAEFAHFKATPATVSPDGRRLFFRGHRSTADILELARGADFVEFTNAAAIVDSQSELDFGSSCEESCEIGADGRGQFRYEEAP